MYTLEQLQTKTFKQLKKIGWELNLLPADDKRQKQTWIDALVSEKLRLLELLKVSPAAVVESVAEAIEVQHQEPPIETPPGVEVEPAAEVIDLSDNPILRTYQLGGRNGFSSEVIEQALELVEQHCYPNICRRKDYTDSPIENSLAVQLAAKVLPGVARFQEQEPELSKIQDQKLPIKSKFGRIIYPKPAAEPIAQATEFDAEAFRETHGAEIDAYEASFTDDRPPNRGDNDRDRLESEPKLSQSAIASAGKNSPGVNRKTSTAHELLELFKSSAVILEPIEIQRQEPIEIQRQEPIKIQRQEPIEIQRQEPIENSPGVTFSTHFLVRYSPPQSESIRYQADGDGQLNLLQYRIESVDEPPNPDDYSTEFEFWAAYDAWCDRSPDDVESLDVFGELPAGQNAQNPESLTVSMDSMREWAQCPDDWYEPAAEILPPEASSMEVRELSPATETIESSSTCNFSIPTFDVWCDRQNDKDEPPDSGSFARLPKPKPPSFPPRAVVAGDRTNRIKKLARSAILSSGRAPPGGDALQTP